MSSKLSDAERPVSGQDLDPEEAERLAERAQEMDAADEEHVWDRVHQHQKENHGETKADQVFAALRQETAQVPLDGVVETDEGPVEIDVEVECYRVPIQGLLDFIGDWNKLQQLEDVDEEDVDRIEIDGMNPKEFANELAEDAYEHVDNLVVNPYESGFHSQRLREEPYGLEVAADLIMSAADAFGAEVDDAGNTESQRRAKPSRRS